MTSRNLILLIASLTLNGCVYYSYRPYPTPYTAYYSYPPPQPYSYPPQNYPPQNYPPSANSQMPPGQAPNPGEPTDLQPH